MIKNFLLFNLKFILVLADLVILQCKNEIEAIRLRLARLYVLKAGKIIARTNPVNSEVFPESELKPDTHPNTGKETFCP